MTTRDKEYVKACLQEAIRWIDENDNLPDRRIDMGVWFSDLTETEMLAFVEHPRYAEDYLVSATADEVEPYQVILIRLDRKDFEEYYEDDN